MIFFFKLPRHTMRDVLAFVASQLLGREDAQAATWQRVEELLRLRVSPQPEQRGWHAQPVLLVLDSLSDEERTKMRQIVGRMGGRVRCVLGVDTHSQLQADRTLAALPPQRNAHVIPLQPLSMPERAAMLGRLLQRSGAAHVPANLQHVTASAAAGAPLYLAMVAAYLKACVLLGVQPAPLKALKQDATALLTFDLLPTIESAVGEKQPPPPPSLPYKVDTSRPSLRTNWTRLVGGRCARRRCCPRTERTSWGGWPRRWKRPTRTPGVSRHCWTPARSTRRCSSCTA